MADDKSPNNKSQISNSKYLDPFATDYGLLTKLLTTDIPWLIRALVGCSRD